MLLVVQRADGAWRDIGRAQQPGSKVRDRPGEGSCREARQACATVRVRALYWRGVQLCCMSVFLYVHSFRSELGQ